MRIKTQILSDVAILTPTGTLSEGMETDALHEAINALFLRGNQKLIVDLGEAVVVGNRPLGVLFRAWADYAKRDDRVVFCRVGKIERRIIRMDRPFEVYETVKEALWAFGLDLTQNGPT